ncbi:MAG TPA: cytochrome c oxidase subunit 3 [Pseudomonadales bacterium]
MTIAVVIFGLFMASLVGWLVKQSVGTRPWVAAGPAPELPSPEQRTQQSLRVGLVVLIAVIASLFGLFMSAYLMRMEYADWRPIGEPQLLWINTGVLALCSVALQWAYFAARGGAPQSLRVAFAAGGVLSLAFVAGQYVVWQQLNALGYYLDANPASAFFFVLTGLHVLHLLGGLVAWGRTAIRLWSGTPPAELAMSVELCAVYWHFLLAVWVVLFALLSST